MIEDQQPGEVENSFKLDHSHEVQSEDENQHYVEDHDFEGRAASLI
jgi:hypothetical protein